jgi:hypothetical protein
VPPACLQAYRVPIPGHTVCWPFCAGHLQPLYFPAFPSKSAPAKVEDMVGIILEGVLFVALIATVAALLFFGVYYLTPLGLRLTQDRNRRELERELDLTCPIHGLQQEEEMVRLPSGSRICPVCYKEALHE